MPDQDDLYYIQNAGRPVGNSARWWRPEGAGYTSDLNDAWRVTGEKARQIAAGRPGEDIPYQVAAVDAISERHVDVQRLREIAPLSHKP